MQATTLHDDLPLYLEQTTGRVIRDAVHADTTDAEMAGEPAGLR